MEALEAVHRDDGTTAMGKGGGNGVNRVVAVESSPIKHGSHSLDQTTVLSDESTVKRWLHGGDGDDDDDSPDADRC